LVTIFEACWVASLTSSFRPHWLDFGFIKVGPSPQAVSDVGVAEFWHLLLVPYDFGIKSILCNPVRIRDFFAQVIFGKVSTSFLLLPLYLFKLSTGFLLTRRHVLFVSVVPSMTFDGSSGHKIHFVMRFDLLLVVHIM
jgi:hypothetical protein